MSGGGLPWSQSDLTEYGKTGADDKTKIGQSIWVPCRICWAFFGRARLTDRYCGRCGRACCEGEHGSFVPDGPVICIRCRAAKDGLA